MPKPRVITKCVANSYTGPTERIVEFSSGGRSDLKGGLIALRNLPNGKLLLNVYRCDPGVEVVHYHETDAEGAAAALVRNAAPDMLRVLVDFLKPGSVNAAVIEEGRDLLAKLGHDVRPTKNSEGRSNG